MRPMIRNGADAPVRRVATAHAHKAALSLCATTELWVGDTELGIGKTVFVKFWLILKIRNMDHAVNLTNIDKVFMDRMDRVYSL